MLRTSADHLPKNLGKDILSAVLNNNLELTRNLLLQAEKHQFTWDTWVTKGTENYAIHSAIERNNLPMVKLLISHGAHLNYTNKAEETALDVALKKEFDEIALQLLWYDNIEAKKLDDYILLQVLLNKLNLAETLIDYAIRKGRTWEKADSATRNYALHWAVFNNNLAMISMLLKKKVSINHKNKDDLTPLDLALKSKNRAIILALLKVDYIQCKELGSYILDAVAENDYELTLNYLQYAKKNNLRWDTWSFERTGNYAIHTAVKNKNLKLLKLLVANDALFNKKNHLHQTPLYLAMMNGSSDIVLFLLELEGHKPGVLLDYLLKAFEAQDYPLAENILELMAKNKIPLITGALVDTKHFIIEEDSKHDLFTIRVRSDVFSYLLTDEDIGLIMLQLLKCRSSHVENYHSYIVHALATNNLALLETIERRKLKTSIRRNDLYHTKLLMRPTEHAELAYKFAKDCKHTRISDLFLQTMSIKPDISQNAYFIGLEFELNKIISLCQKAIKEISPSSLKLAQAIIKLLQKYSDFSLSTIYQKVDYICFIQGLTHAINTANNEVQFKDLLLKLFSAREDLILNSSLDYCYDSSLITNRLAYAIAELLSEPDGSPYNILLKKATLFQRIEPWFDPGVGVEAKALPDAKDFFRVDNNEIHLYEYVINQAFARVKSSNLLQSHIWFGTDAKNIQPVPPLSQTTLALLKQRSPSLKKFIIYTEELDYFSKISNNLLIKFKNLKNGLLAGDYQHAGTHLTAGSPANVAIAEFSEWWNSLDEIFKNNIKEISHMHGESHESFGDALDIILYQGGLHDKQRETDAIYCVHLKAHIIERLLEDKCVEEKLNKLSSNRTLELTKRISTTMLDKWQADILSELAHTRYIFNPECGFFPDLLVHGELNTFLLKHQAVNYHNFIGKNQLQDSQTLINYIFSENNNENLLKMYELLNSNIYDYLRTRDPRENNYFALVRGVRTIVCETYSIFERSLSLQLIKNSVRGKKSSLEATLAIQQLYKICPFINNNRTNRYLTTGTSSFSIFKANKNLHQSMLDLNNKIYGIKVK